MNEVVQDILDFSKDDWVGIWVIASEVKQKFENTDPAFVQKMVLRIVEEIMKHGLIAGNSPYSSAGFLPWTDQSVAFVLCKIKNDWEKLGHEPDIGDIVYFGNKH